MKTTVKMECSSWKDQDGDLHVTLTPLGSELASMQLIVRADDPLRHLFAAGVQLDVDIHGSTNPQEALEDRPAVPGLRHTFDARQAPQEPLRVPTVKEAQALMKDQLSAAVGSSASQQVSGVQVRGADGVTRPADGTMKATRNAQGGISYEITVDPIVIGTNPAQVTTG